MTEQETTALKKRLPHLLRPVRWLPVALPLVFIILFYGFLPPRYDVILYTDNIVGEGICTTSTSAPVSFSPFYETEFYFGSELKRATIIGYNYDVDRFILTVSGVSEAEMEGFDLRVFGITIGHYNQVGRILEGQYKGVRVSYTEDGQRVHFDFEDPDAAITIGIISHFAPVWFWAAYIALIAVLSILLSMLLSVIEDRVPAIRLPLLSASAILTTILAGCFFCGSLPYVQYTNILLNWLFFFALSLAVNAVTLPFIGTVATMAFATFWYIANYFVIIFRNKPIMPSDLKAIGTAAEVMGGYVFAPSWKMIVGVIVVLGYAVAVIHTWRRTRPAANQSRRSRILKRFATAAMAVLLMVAGVNTRAFKSLDSFAWDAALLKSFHQEGMVLTYLKSALNSRVERPEGYKREAIDEYLAQYAGQEAEGIRPTNIIMVMNEAFSDLRTIGLDDRIDVMPFIDSLDENTVSGNLYVSIYGGGTCNTEFEALTGNTLAFLGTGAYPYTENVTDPLFSLASYFRDAGYDAEAFHPNEAHNWNRNMVYPNLGFAEFHDIYDYAEALEDVPYLHKHPADQADYSYLEKVSAEKSGQPRFLFNVTMQNHSGYEHWEDVEKADSVIRWAPDLYEDTKVYLSLIKASDDEVRQLVETYRDADEPTMIVFFGDHQPGLPTAAQNEIYTEAEYFLDWYKSKFFIWTNYESEAVHDVAVSANFLPCLILERGNFPLPPYVQMLKEVHEKYPVISAMGVIDAEGNVYGSVNDVLDDPLVQKYQYIQYANLFDELDPAWFEVPDSPEPHDTIPASVSVE